MDNISMQKEEFQFDFFPQSSSPLLFRPDSDQENEPFEQTHKLRKLNPHSPDTNSHNTPQNIPHKSSLLLPTDTKAPTQPEKQLVKPNYSSLSGMDHLRKYLGDNYPAVVKKALAKLQPLSAQPYHAQLEQMRLLGIHQEKEVENHIVLRKGYSVSTATCSPCSSLRSSFNCLLSPGNDEELKMSMVDGSNSTMNGDLKKEVQNHKKAQMAANTNLRRTVSLPPEANPLMKEGSTTGDLMSQVLPLSPEMNAKKLNNTQAPFPQYQNQQQVDMGWNSQLEAPMITRCLSQGMANVGDQAGKSYRSLVDSQMQAIQSLVQNKRSFNQMNSLQNNGIEGNYNQVQGLGAQRTVSGGPISTPNDSEAMKKLWIQRWNYQRAMQYRAAAMQKKSFMMMQEKLEMKNDQNNIENTTVNNVMDFQPNSSKVLPEQGLEFPLQENQKADNIDHFFVTSDQPVLQEKLITENHASDDFIGFNNKEFFNTENLLDPFAEDAIGSHKKGWLFDEDDTPLSLRNIF